MARNVVVVESPAKAKTIYKYLGRDFAVTSSKGHIRDLPPKDFGIDIENGFKPTYVPIQRQKSTIKRLKEETKQAEVVYLALDMDREGEAIAWHVKEALGLDDQKVRRMTFNEITKSAILSALEKAGPIDMDKVNAQQARRLLDRIVGYKVSPLLWKKVAKGLSAGRVQTVAVRLIVEREKEITDFKPQEYWKITATLHPESREEEVFEAGLTKKDGEKIDIKTEKEALNTVEELRSGTFILESLSRKEKTVKAPPPFTTSLMQQQASIQLRFSASKTMRIAQQLYEGIELGPEGSTGLITYMRTDSFRVSSQGLKDVREAIESDFGAEYMPEKPNFFRSKKGAQEAHEAIHPTSCKRTPEELEQFLNKDQLRLYELIWRRFVASQMAPARYEFTDATILNGPYLFSALGRKMLFDGFTKVLGRDVKEVVVPELRPGEPLVASDILPTQHFTEPPKRYTEASLVRALESKGIGRPSTYAPIIQTIQQRGYVRQLQRRFHATDVGIITTEKLIRHFPKIFDVKFTSDMEEKLDEIEDAKAEWKRVLGEFYGEFEEALELATSRMKKASEEMEESPYTCELCGKPMVYRLSKTGKFLGCSGFPKCKNTKPLDKDNKPLEVKETCEKCGSPMAVKVSRYGRQFLACTGFPKCKNTKPMPTGVKCPREGCDGDLVRKRARGKRSFYGCSHYPECDYTTYKLPAADENEA
jgi:DNA topoisomerase-1